MKVEIVNIHMMNIDSGSISANKATYMGGGIYRGCPTNVTSTTISGNTADYSGAIVNNNTTITLAKNTVSGNKATYLGGGIYNYNGKLVSLSGTISGNKAASCGGIYSLGELFFGGTSAITGNQAITGCGGGVYSIDSKVTFDGTKATIKSNNAHLPTSVNSWDQGYGVYLVNCTISVTNGFNQAKQITGNVKVCWKYQVLNEGELTTNLFWAHICRTYLLLCNMRLCTVYP